MLNKFRLFILQIIFFLQIFLFLFQDFNVFVFHGQRRALQLVKKNIYYIKFPALATEF